MEACLGETGISGAEIGSLLLASAALQPDSHRLRSLQARLIGDGDGFLSRVFRCSLEWEPPSPALPTSIVAKVPTGDVVAEMGRTEGKESAVAEAVAESDHFATIFVPISHRNEAAVFRLFGTAPPLPAPRLYFEREITASGPGLILMEDLAGKVMVPYMEGFRESQAMELLAKLAALHAWSLRRSDWAGELVRMPREGMASWEQLLTTSAEQLTAMAPSLFGEKLTKTFAFAHKPEFIEEMNARRWKAKGFPGVLVHGDLWTNNILMEPSTTEANGASDEVATILDWQMAHEGCFATDLVLLIGSGLEGELRRRATENLLDHYYRCLEKEMSGSKAVPWSREDVGAMFKEYLPYAVAFQIIQVPLMASTVKDDEERLRRCVHSMVALVDDTITACQL